MKKVIGKVKDQLSSSSDALGNAYGDAVGKLNNGLKKIGNLGADAKTKVTTVANEVIAILPILEKFGYKTTELRVGVSIVPTIELDVQRVKEIPKEEHDKMLEEYSARKMFSLIVKAIESAISIQDNLSIGDEYFHEFSLQITIPPNVGIKYRLKEGDHQLKLIDGKIE